MPSNDYKKKITEFIKSSKPRSSSHKVTSQDEFLDGVVAKVEYTDGTQQLEEWIIVTGKYTNYASNESQLIQQMNAASKSHSTKFEWVNQIFNVGGIIAFVLVGTACYMSVNNPATEIPEYLKTVLLTIVGFYFGGLVNQGFKKRQQNEIA